ncbi:unnamed protein product, partial [Prorocentrum cordatum]
SLPVGARDHGERRPPPRSLARARRPPTRSHGRRRELRWRPAAEASDARARRRGRVQRPAERRIPEGPCGQPAASRARPPRGARRGGRPEVLRGRPRRPPAAFRRRAAERRRGALRLPAAGGLGRGRRARHDVARAVLRVGRGDIKKTLSDCQDLANRLSKQVDEIVEEVHRVTAEDTPDAVDALLIRDPVGGNL